MATALQLQADTKTTVSAITNRTDTQNITQILAYQKKKQQPQITFSVITNRKLLSIANRLRAITSGKLLSMKEAYKISKTTTHRHLPHCCQCSWSCLVCTDKCYPHNQDGSHRHRSYRHLSPDL